MEGYTCFVLVGILCISAVSSDFPDVTLTPAITQYKKVGDSLTLTCDIAESTTFLVSREAVFIHRNLITNAETTLTRQSSKLEGIPNFSNYEVHLKFGEKISVTLTIKEITIDMDGEFSCKIKPMSEDKWLNMASVELVVVEPPTAIEMTIGSQVITSEMSQGLKLKDGAYSVTCKAVGSNPQASLTLMLGDKKMNPSEDPVEYHDTDVQTGRSFISEIQGRFEFNHELFNKVLGCVAKLPESVSEMGFSPIKATVELIGIAEKPVVKCRNSSSAVGDRYVTITCVVTKESRVLDVAFELGSTNTVLRPGEQMQDFTEVSQKDFNETHDAVSLIIHTAERGHFFEEYYFNVKGADGIDYRYPVHLNMIALGASSVYASVFLLFAACLAAVFSSRVV